jgi:RND family efflux transporter MFP subunit
MSINGRPALGLGIPLIWAAVSIATVSQPADTRGRYPAISRPSELRELAVAVRGRVDRVTVAPGDTVTVGQELLALEDAVQRRSIELAKLASEDDSALRNAILTRDYWSEEVRLTRESLTQGGASETELRDARHKLGQAELAVEASRRQHEEARVQLDREVARLDEMRVVCPIDGRVLEVHKRKGETADEQTKVITVVSTDPLWLEVNVPTSDALKLRSGQPAKVHWQDVNADISEMSGHIIFVSPAGHAGARQVQVRVEVPNPDRLPSGMHGDVTFLANQSTSGGGP